MSNQIPGISALNPVLPVLGIENSIINSLLAPPKPSWEPVSMTNGKEEGNTKLMEGEQEYAALKVKDVVIDSASGQTYDTRLPPV